MEVSYYPGCSLKGMASDYSESAEAICETLGVELKELEDWTCCGASSAHITSDYLAVALPAKELEQAEKVGLDLVIPCAACYLRVKAAQKELSGNHQPEGISYRSKGNIQIKHLADFLSESVGTRQIEAKVKKPLKGLKPVCYYGCLTTRPPKMTDSTNPEDPQSMDEIMRALGADVKNWSYKTDCCGGSLVLPRLDILKRLIQKLFDMAQEAGADCIVVGCPMCHGNLDQRQSAVVEDTGKHYDLPIYYFTELMALAFGEPKVEKWVGKHLVEAKGLLQQRGLL
jgi:heterodisulfide reductase subunit B